MDPEIPIEILPLLEEFTNRLNAALPGLVTGFYLVGSIAQGGFNSRLSDVDFVALLSRRAAAADRTGLLNVHQQVEKLNYPWHLEGGYFQRSDLGCGAGEIQPFPNYHDGRLTWKGRDELSQVTWWILQRQGMAVFGPPPGELDFSVDLKQMLRGQRANLLSYWASWTRRPIRMALLLSDWGIQWTVLGVLRQFYTLRERDLTTKTGAGEYALTCLPQRWHRVIREAIRLRDTPARSLYHSRLARACDAYLLLQYIFSLFTA
jgi:hypothetical protein